MSLNHGMLSTPQAALAYAFVLLRASPRLASIAGSDLRADVSDDVWRVTKPVPGSQSRDDVLTLSHVNGKVLSGNL